MDKSSGKLLHTEIYFLSPNSNFLFVLNVFFVEG